MGIILVIVGVRGSCVHVQVLYGSCIGVVVFVVGWCCWSWMGMVVVLFDVLVWSLVGWGFCCTRGPAIHLALLRFLPVLTL